MENIWVSVRVRPPAPHQVGKAWKIYENTISLCTPSVTQSFSFDEVFGSDSRNEDVYQAHPKQLAMAVVSGFNGTIFAYGQTNSGKTYMMHGTTIDPGIIPLAVIDVFENMKMVTSREFLVRVSYMEIYNEEIRDLLSPENCKLEIHENQERGVFVAGLKELIVNGPQQVLDILQFGEVHRHFGGTNMNANSSRSHAIFRMVIESKRKTNQSTTDVLDSDAVQVSTLHMIDLAGFERISKTGADGSRLREGTYINRSLVTLSNVIKKLSDGIGNQGGHIPYRDSKLTRILQPVLGGNAKISIICNVSPSQAHIDETRGTLLFASRAKKVTTCAHVNEIITDAALLKRQQKEIEELRQKLKGTLAEDMEKEVLKLRNDLLKFELEREKMALQLEEERKAQEKKEQLIKEQEQMIENLSSMVMNCSLNTNTTQGRVEEYSRLCPKKETPCVTIRSETDCAVPTFEDLLGRLDKKWCHSSNEEFMPSDFINIADDDTWIGMNNVETFTQPMLSIISCKDGQQPLENIETTSSTEVETTELQLQKFVEENTQLKAHLAEKTNMPNLYMSFILKILELQNGEGRMRDTLKETWMQLLRTEENEHNLRKENISLLLSKTRAEMVLDQIRGQLELLEKILMQASCEHAELHSYGVMVRDMALAATKDVRSIGDAYACLQLLQDNSLSENINCCANFSEILEFGQHDMCNIADPNELIMKSNDRDSEISHVCNNYEKDLAFSDLTNGYPVFDLVNLQGWGKHLTPEEREIAFKVLKRFCMKIERAQAVEAKLAAAELHIVELKVEVDDLRARLEVFNLNSPSLMETELHTLRSQCAFYKKEIELLMEQIPTAEEEVEKQKEFIKIQKENKKVHFRIKKLERQISHVKNCRKELRRLKQVDKERETLLSQLEESLKRNRKLEQELVTLKQESTQHTGSRTTLKAQPEEKSHHFQNLPVFEACLSEAQYAELDVMPYGNERWTNKETASINVESTPARSQIRPALRILNVNRANSAMKPQVHCLNETAYNEISNKENIFVFGN